jgi:hypothetical protein
MTVARKARRSELTTKANERKPLKDEKKLKFTLQGTEGIVHRFRHTSVVHEIRGKAPLQERGTHHARDDKRNDVKNNLTPWLI